MKIECILKREGGSKISLDDSEYHFEPLADGAHVADITQAEHIERLLSIPEGYRIYRSGREKAPAAPAKTAIAAAAAGAVGEEEGEDDDLTQLSVPEGFDTSFEIGGVQYALTDIVARAFVESGLDIDAWNALDNESRSIKVEAVLDGIEERGDERGRLVEAYKARYGRAPHARMTLDTLRTKVAE